MTESQARKEGVVEVVVELVVVVVEEDTSDQNTETLKNQIINKTVQRENVIAPAARNV